MNPEVLKGVRVADFTHAGVGPVTCMALANAGAEVIKIESATRTEVIRRGYPFKQGIEDIEGSAQFAVYNCNKLGVTLNLRHPRAVELARRLVSVSDVVAESFTPGVMERLGLDYDELRKVKPDLIMISMSLMGQTGPRRMHRGHGVVLQAMVGLAQLTGWPELPPMAVSIAYTDYYVPSLWVLSVLGALIYRNRTGKGQYIDGSDYEAAIDLIGTALVDYGVNGRIKERQGNRHPYAAPHGCYRCQGADRWCTIAVFSDKEWKAFCRALGDPEWARDARFSTLMGRLAHQDELDELTGSWTGQRSAEEVMRMMQEAGVMAGVVQNSRDLHQDPQLRHRGHFWELAEDPEKQWFTYEDFGYRLSQTPYRMKRPFPHLGEHNYYVFCELLGLSDEEFAALVQEGVIQ